MKYRVRFTDEDDEGIKEVARRRRKLTGENVTEIDLIREATRDLIERELDDG